MIPSAEHDPVDPAHTSYSADELKRMREDVRALLTVAMKAAASHTVALMQPPEPDERAGLLERLKENVAQAQAEFAARGPEAVREASRFACDALRLFRACHRERCRKARACRGDPVACCERAPVPEPAREWVTGLLLAEQLPWLPLLAEGNAANRAAYECWIAGIEAGRSVRPPSARPRSRPASG